MDENWLWWGLATFIAFFIKGLCGFANTLVFTSILSYKTSNLNISPIELLLGYPTNVIIAWKERKRINYKLCFFLSGLIISGSIPGILFLKNTDAAILKIAFGVVVVIISIEMLFRKEGFHSQKQSKIIQIGMGVASGLLCGLYGVGALLGAYVSRVTSNSSSFKANLCLVFFVENTIRILFYIVWGIITIDILKQIIVLVPVMLGGLFIGMYCTAIIKEDLVKKIVIVLLMVSGIVLVSNNLMKILGW